MPMPITNPPAVFAEAPPAPTQEWLSSLPSQNVGTLYAKIKDPITHIEIEYKVDGWGQLCDGTDHRMMVEYMLYNSFPFHGKGFTYVSWRAEPDNPEANKHPRTGKVENPKPFPGNLAEYGR